MPRSSGTSTEIILLVLGVRREASVEGGVLSRSVLLRGPLPPPSGHLASVVLLLPHLCAVSSSPVPSSVGDLLPVGASSSLLLHSQYRSN